MKIVTLTGQNRRFDFFRFWSKVAILMSLEKIVTALDGSVVFARWRQCAPHQIHASLGQPASISQTDLIIVIFAPSGPMYLGALKTYSIHTIKSVIYLVMMLNSCIVIGMIFFVVIYWCWCWFIGAAWCWERLCKGWQHHFGSLREGWCTSWCQVSSDHARFQYGIDIQIVSFILVVSHYLILTYTSMRVHITTHSHCSWLVISHADFFR